MREPYIYLSARDEWHVAECWGQEGVETTIETGTHAVWAARIPYIPPAMTSDFTRTLTGGEFSRTAIITRRMKRFVADLATTRLLVREGAGAFELRYIVRPGATPGELSRVEIVILGKGWHRNRHEAEALARCLWAKLSAHYPLEDPFAYPLEPVDEVDFQTYFQPLAATGDARQIVEITKYEDVDPLTQANETPVGLLIHPWAPSFDMTGLGRFIETLASQQQACVVSVCLTPTELYNEEARAIHLLLATYERQYVATEHSSWLQNWRRERLEDMQAAWWPLVNHRKFLFKIRISVIGSHFAPDDVVEGLGSELLENSMTSEPRHWARLQPRTHREYETAWYSFTWLEQALWGHSLADAPLRRLRSLVTAYEAAGAFRLPTPAEAGYLPGIPVKDEPFFAPRGTPSISRRSLVLGEVMHRGLPSGELFHLPLDELRQHVLIAGSTGYGKSITTLWLLSQLWREYRIPFLIMYPIAKSDYRLLMADRAVQDDLLVFTLGDSRTSPFAFNPFHVADGVLVRTHIANLVRCFEAAAYLFDPLPAILRHALRTIYQENGWDIVAGVGGMPDVRTPTLAEFYDTLTYEARRLTEGYGSEVRGDIQKASDIRVFDVLANLGPLLNTRAPAPMDVILQRPTLLEFGKLRGDDQSLVMAFWLTQLVEEIESRARRMSSRERQQWMHVTLLEEAHRVMGIDEGGSTPYRADTRRQAREDFANLLAEVRGHREAMIIVEQIPTRLVPGAVGNTGLKIGHRLADPSSVELFNTIMALNERQRAYARQLAPGQALVRDASGYPVVVQVTDYEGVFRDHDGQLVIDDSDEAVRQFMTGRLQVPVGEPWPSDPLAGYLDIPEREAVLHLDFTLITERQRDIGEAADRRDWQEVALLCLEQVAKGGLPPDRLVARAFLAHLASQRQQSGEHAGQRIYDSFPACRAALENFPLA